MPSDSTNLNNKAKAQNTFDAIVIGSGISGGWAAKELTEKGLKVLMLERGRNFEHLKDYKTAAKNPWEFEHRGKTTAKQKEDYPVIHRGWAASEPVMDSWVNEKDAPYTEVKPLPGGAVTSWVAGLFYGAGKVIAGVIWILKQMEKKV